MEGDDKQQQEQRLQKQEQAPGCGSKGGLMSAVMEVIQGIKDATIGTAQPEPGDQQADSGGDATPQAVHGDMKGEAGHTTTPEVLGAVEGAEGLHVPRGEAAPGDVSRSSESAAQPLSSTEASAGMLIKLVPAGSNMLALCVTVLCRLLHLKHPRSRQQVTATKQVQEMSGLRLQYGTVLLSGSHYDSRPVSTGI